MTIKTSHSRMYETQFKLFLEGNLLPKKHIILKKDWKQSFKYPSQEVREKKRKLKSKERQNKSF